MKSRWQKQQAGFTMMEVLVAMTIMALVSAAMAPVFHQHAKTNTEMEKRTAAVEAAQQILDLLRFSDMTTLPTSGAGTTQTINTSGYAFSATPYYCRTADLCQSTSTRHITVEISYQNEKIYELETVYTKLR